LNTEQRPVLGSVLRAQSIGSFAVREISQTVTGRIAAVFDRSVYVDLGNQWICVGDATVGNGPVNLLLEPTPHPGVFGGLVVDQTVRVCAGAVHLGERPLSIDTTAKVWSPPLVSDWTHDTLTRGLDALNVISRGRAPKQGLGVFLCSPGSELSDTRETRVCAPVVSELESWIRDRLVDMRCVEGVPESVQQLIGLGPGLTPSGDDFLGGVLIALSLVQRRDIAALLYADLCPRLLARTGPISRTHLAAASAGQGLETLHLAINSVIEGNVEMIPDRLRHVDRIGCSSGWDALAGAYVVLRACLVQPAALHRSPLWTN
jgi:hypothetical protein